MNRFTLSRRPHVRKRRSAVRLLLELLESRNLLDSGLANVLVNNPALDTTAQDTQSETAIVLGDKSNIIVAYNDDGNFSFTPLNPDALGYSLSTDGGKSFTDKGEPPPNQPYWQGTDPTLAHSSKTGTIFLASTSGNTDVNKVGERVLIGRSADNGASFAAPVDASPDFVLGVDRVDKPWIAVDNNPGPGYGNVYLAWTDFTFKNNGTLTEKGIYFTRSTNDGQDWGPSGGVPIAVKPGNNPKVQGAFVTVGPDHAIYVFWWDGTNSQTIVMSKSTDQGQSFSAPIVVTPLRTNGSNGDLSLTDSTGRTFGTSAFPQAAVNSVTGDIYVVYPDQRTLTGDKADIFFTESADGGATWSAPLRVNDDKTTNDQWNPAIAMTPDGSHVGIFWYDRRLDPANNLIDRFGAIGTVSDHNVSFAPNFRITDVSFPPAFGQDPFWTTFVNYTSYMGDYDMATADNDYFYTTWGDNRLANAFHANQPDVRLAKVPVDWLAPNALSTTNPATTSATTRSGGALTASFASPLSNLSLLSRTDFNAAGRGWFDDSTPSDDSLFTTPADQREQHSLTFAPGETTKTITIEVKGDSKKEADETFYLDLFGNSSNSLFTKNRGVGTILNDD